MESQKTYYILEPSQFIPFVNARSWLGTLVSDFKKPLATAITKHSLNTPGPMMMIPAYQNAIASSFSDPSTHPASWAALDNTKVVEDTSKPRVSRYWLPKPQIAFAGLQADPPMINHLLARCGLNTSVYMIVGILLADEMELEKTDPIPYKLSENCMTQKNRRRIIAIEYRILGREKNTGRNNRYLKFDIVMKDDSMSTVAEAEENCFIV